MTTAISRTTKDKVKKIEVILDRLYPTPAIPLLHEDPYTLLIAVVLSAQCTDRRVNLVTPQLFSTARTPEAMSQLPVEIIQQIIRPCGLSQRKAKAIQKLSQMIVEIYKGEVPCDMRALESLPGVGHKTASVVMAQAFEIAAFPVDTHIHRLAHRWGLSSGKNVIDTERDLKKIFPEASWHKIHLQIIYFAREYCPALRHIKEVCPICSWI